MQIADMAENFDSGPRYKEEVVAASSSSKTSMWKFSVLNVFCESIGQACSFINLLGGYETVA